MILARRWQAWAAMGLVVGGLLLGVVAPGQTYNEQLQRDYGLSEQQADSILHLDDRGRQRLGFGDADDRAAEAGVWSLPQPTPPEEQGQARLRIGELGLSIDGRDQPDDDAAFAQLVLLKDRNRELRVTLVTDEDVPYARVVEIMDRLNAMGVTNIALATDP